jgi:hypothetical protein
MPSPGRRAQLQIYVSSECVNCAEAHRLAREADGRFRDVAVEVIDLAARVLVGQIPEVVIAVPTYAPDGRVASLVNPDPEELFTRLQQAVAQ